MKKFNKIFVCGISRTGTKSLGDYFKLLDLKVTGLRWPNIPLGNLK